MIDPPWRFCRIVVIRPDRENETSPKEEVYGAWQPIEEYEALRLWCGLAMRENRGLRAWMQRRRLMPVSSKVGDI